MAQLSIRFFVSAAVLLAGTGCSADDGRQQPPNSITIPESGMSYGEFRKEARSIARTGGFERMILRRGNLLIPIRIPLLDGDAGTPWHPYVINRISKEKEVERLIYKINGRFLYLVCPGAICGEIGVKDFRKNLADAKAISSKKIITPCVVLVCHPNEEMIPIVEALVRIQSLVNDRIVFIDALGRTAAKDAEKGSGKVSPP